MTKLQPQGREFQQPMTTQSLTGVTGPHTGIDDRVRATFGQIDALDLREGAGATVRGVATKGGGIGGGIGYRFGAAIERDQAQAKQKGTTGLGGGDRTADRIIS